MEGVIYDVRDALRSLRRRPGFAVGHDREGGDAFSPWAVESRRGGLPAHRPARVGSRAGWCKRDRRIWSLLATTTAAVDADLTASALQVKRRCKPRPRVLKQLR